MLNLKNEEHFVVGIGPNVQITTHEMIYGGTGCVLTSSQSYITLLSCILQFSMFRRTKEVYNKNFESCMLERNQHYHRLSSLSEQNTYYL